jgi:hypothetical protein
MATASKRASPDRSADMADTTNEKSGEKPDHGGASKKNPLLKIVKEHDPKAKAKDERLDLGLDEFDGDHRYGREDIADK